jgi:hypothetical protein
MLDPDVGTRVEERSNRVALWVKRRKITTLVAIALKAGKRQIVECCLPTVFDSNNVVNFVDVETDLWLVTIFAPPPSPVDDSAAEVGRDRGGH